MKIRIMPAYLDAKDPNPSCVVEIDIVVKALRELLGRQRQAYEMVKHTTAFRPEDFSIPQIAEVVCIMEDWK